MIKTYSAETVLREKEFLSETVFGTSMLPLLKENRDTVVIENITQSLRKYDVVLFRRGEQLVLHRITKVMDGYFIIRGDNCICGEKVLPNQIIGIMTHFSRKGKQYAVNNKIYQLYSRIGTKGYFFALMIAKNLRILLRKVKKG